MSLKPAIALGVLGLATTLLSRAQGTFSNLDFENGTFLPIPGDPYGRVYWGTAMPGWTGYVGDDQTGWALYNNMFLDNPGIAVWGPNFPYAGMFHGRFFAVLASGSFPGGYATCSIAQTGMVPLGTRSLRYLTDQKSSPGFVVTFAGHQIPLSLLGGTVNGNWIWGGDISFFAGQIGELRFAGGTYLDNIELSTIPIPEPASGVLLVLATLACAWGMRRQQV